MVDLDVEKTQKSKKSKIIAYQNALKILSFLFSLRCIFDIIILLST